MTRDEFMEMAEEIDAEGFDLTTWEKDFIDNALCAEEDFSPSKAQVATMEKIYEERMG